MIDIRKLINLKQGYKFLKRNELTAILVALIFIFSVANAFHFSYTDEWEKITGGSFILQGKLPYKDFFSNHGPVGYFYCALINIFSFGSFVIFRIIHSLVLAASFVLFAFLIKNKFGPNYFKITLGAFIFITVGATYWWGHMVLADTLASYFFIFAYIYLIFKILINKRYSSKEVLFLAFLISGIILNSLTYLYAALFLYLFLLISYLKNNRFNFKDFGLFLLYIVSPYLIFCLYLLLTSSWNDYIYQSIIFNKKYYIKLADGGEINNPLRHMIVITVTFFDKFRAVLLGVKDLNFGYPLPVFYALASLGLITLAFLRRQFLFGSLVIFSLIFINARSDPFNTTETDYQASGYIVFSIFNGFLLWAFLKEEILNTENNIRSLLSKSYLLLFGIFFFFSILFISSKFIDKVYTKYMGQLPLIYDRPEVATVMNKLITKDDYFFVGPYEPQEYFYIHGRLATRYYFSLPQMDKSEKIRNEILEDFKKNKPKVVVFKEEDQILGDYPARSLVAYLKENYFTPDSLNYPHKTYQIYNKFPQDARFDFSRHFYFLGTRKEEIIKQLIEQGLISKIE